LYNFYDDHRRNARKIPSTLNLSKAEPQSTNECSRNNDARSVAPTAVKKGRHPLRVKTSVKAGGITVNHNVSQLTVKTGVNAGEELTRLESVEK
jgi:hypothetical protein